MSVVEALPQMQVAGPATPGAGREAAGQLGLGRGGERTGVLVADVYLIDAALG
jgi:hypothetical protein